MYALRIENTSESDPHRYEATKAVVKKAQKKIEAWTGFEPHDLCDTGAMFYQLIYEALLVVGKREFNLYPL